MLDLGAPACDKHGRTPKYQGKEVTIQGTTFVLARWNLKTLRVTAPWRKAIRDAVVDSEEFYANNLKVIAAAISMNYPDVTEDLLEEQLSLPDVKMLGDALFELNGGKADQSGEAERVTEMRTTTQTNGTTLSSSLPESGDGSGITSKL